LKSSFNNSINTNTRSGKTDPEHTTYTLQIGQLVATPTSQTGAKPCCANGTSCPQSCFSHIDHVT
ncbi:hypothetical protein, partial [Tritonibacter sp. SIMBA_163]|uniref:hypothetical protein n=1 Tax=Tritonibacter sp. SIMBA_163 TaxID=3080868 RepID=UPI00397FF7C7